jgi:hypothetical protein
MSTEPMADGRRARSRRRRRGLFLGTFAAVVGVLAAVGLVGAAASGMQGPRMTAVEVDPAAAATASGARLIVTMNQSLEKVKPAQVRITPATPFTVDTSGRGMGVRFTLPLHDDTEYTVRFTGIQGLGGGPAATVTRTFRTPKLHVYLLQRTTSGDTIVRTDLAGTEPVPVFRNDHIEDFRVTSSHLVVSVLDDDQHARLIVTDLDGTHRRDLPLPGTGTVSALQSADRGELIGYTYTDADVGTAGARESALYTASVKDAAAAAKPTPVAVTGKEKRVVDWHFVPDTDSILVLTYDGRLLLSGASGADATDLGTGTAIDGIARGSSVAVIQRADGMFTVDLTDGKQAPLVDATSADGVAVPGFMGVVTPIPGTKAGSIRPYSLVAGPASAQGTTIYRVAESGVVTAFAKLPSTAAILQTCVSPSGRYAAILAAPDVVANPYDTYLLPMPNKVVTHVVEISSGHEVHAFSGFDISWCQVPPPPSQ